MEDSDLLISKLNAKPINFDYPLHGIELYVPDAEAVRNWYELQLSTNPTARFPFWAKLWPSSIALAEYIIENDSFIAGKKVLEIAGGLGLPSLAAAASAREVIFTDVDHAAVSLFSKLISINKKTNLTAFTLDWNSFPAGLSADVLLLSDVNYDDASFQSLHSLIHTFLDKGLLVLLSTPMRLIGRPFIEPLLSLALDHQVKSVAFSGTDSMITILALKRSIPV